MYTDKVNKYHFVYQYIRLIGLISRVFASGLGDLGSIPGQVKSKTQKWYLMPTCLTCSIMRYGSRVKWSNPGNGVALSPTPQLLKREPSGHPQFRSSTTFYIYLLVLKE